MLITSRISRRAPNVALRAAVVVAAMVAASTAQAAVYCVSTTQSLLLALGQAAASSVNDDVRLIAGTYTLNDHVALVVRGGLRLRGGYAAGCTAKPDGPTLTTITSGPSFQAKLDLTLNTGDYSVEQISFVGMNSLLLRDDSDREGSGDGTIRVLCNRFIGMHNAVFVFAKYKDTRIENNLFVGREPPAVPTYENLRVNVNTYSTDHPIGVDILFNTVLGARRNLRLREIGPNTTRVWVQNNILWGASESDLHLDVPDVVASNNIWNLYDWSSPGGFDIVTAIISQDPELGAHYVPMPGSPAIDAGTGYVMDGIPSSDNPGWRRDLGDGPDIGAFEYVGWGAASVQ